MEQEEVLDRESGVFGFSPVSATDLPCEFGL